MNKYLAQNLEMSNWESTQQSYRAQTNTTTVNKCYVPVVNNVVRALEDALC